MMLPITVALVSTGMAYLGMVSFGLDMMHLSPGIAFAGMGVFELSLVTVAWLARDAATQNRPGGVLLFLTWLLSSISGTISGVHELYAGQAILVAVFRFIVPLLAALMWHLALIGDRHLATNTTWSSMRERRRMHQFFLLSKRASRAARAAQEKPNAITRWAAARAAARADRAEDRALGVVPPTQMRAQKAEWADATSAAREARDELDIVYGVRVSRAVNNIDTMTSISTERDTRAVPVLASAMEKPNRTAQPARSVPDQTPSDDTVESDQRGGEERDARAADDTAAAGEVLTPRAVARAIACRTEGGDRARGAVPTETITARVDSSPNARAAQGTPKDIEAESARRAADHDDLTARAAAVSTASGERLTEVGVLEAINRRAAGETWTEIGRALGFHRSTIQRAVEKVAPETPAHGLSLADLKQQSAQDEHEDDELVRAT